MSYLNFSTPSGTDIDLNLSRQHILNDGSSDVPEIAIAAIKLLFSLSANGRICDDHLVAVDTVYDEGVLLSPYAIFSPPLHREVCRHANNISEFVWGLREALEAVGTFAFLDKVETRTFYEGTIERILAVFSFSATGNSEYVDVPLDFIHAVVDFFRTSDGCDWNREILGSNDVTVQCISNIINGLAKVYGDDSLAEKARKRRTPSESKNHGWHTFCYSKDQIDRELLEYYEDFMPGSDFNRRSAQSAILTISAWLKEIGHVGSVRDIAMSATRSCSFTDFLKHRTNGEVSKHILSIAEASLKVSDEIMEQLASVYEEETHFGLISLKEVRKLRNAVKKLPQATSTRSRPLPEKMIPIMREILEEGEEGWPGRSGRFVAEVKGSNGVQKIYCPVIPTLFQVMLEIPLRMVQLRRLDSGEGDNVNFNADSMEWGTNIGPLAGYWASKSGGGTNSGDTRGYARELQDELKSITAINVNTNKTGEPHVIPWFVPKALKLLWDLRKWQEAHNPIEAPIGPNFYLDDADKVSEIHKEKMPHIFPIARLMPTKNRQYPGRIATHSEIDHAWGWLLAEIERRWNLRHPGNQVRLVEIHPKSKQPGRHRYNIHGLRVRGLTDLRRGGMPLDLLSKFVAGHATLRMTLYYTVAHPFEISEAIERAIANSEKQRDFIDDLKKLDIDEAKRRSVSLSQTALPEAFESGSQVQFCNVSIGLCPYDGTRCGDGGKLLRKDETSGGSKNIYGSVASRDCVMCRHFISGPPWIEELVAYGTKLLERRQFLALEENRIGEQVGLYEAELKAGNIGKSLFENKYDSLQAEVIKIKDEQETNENGIFNVERLCNACVKLMNSHPEGSDKVMLVAGTELSSLAFEEISEFSQAVWITAMGNLHQILGDDRVEAKRDRYLDLMLSNNEIIPPRLLADITPEHRKMAMDQYALFVSARAKGNELNRLVDGTVRHRDLGIHDEVCELLNTVLTEPVHLPGVPSRKTQALLGGEA